MLISIWIYISGIIEQKSLEAKCCSFEACFPVNGAHPCNAQNKERNKQTHQFGTTTTFKHCVPPVWVMPWWYPFPSSRAISCVMVASEHRPCPSMVEIRPAPFTTLTNVAASTGGQTTTKYGRLLIACYSSYQWMLCTFNHFTMFLVRSNWIQSNYIKNNFIWFHYNWCFVLWFNLIKHIWHFHGCVSLFVVFGPIRPWDQYSSIFHASKSGVLQHILH